MKWSKRALTRAFVVLVAALSMVVGGSAGAAQAIGPGGTQVYNFGNAGIGIVVNWPGYDYVLCTGCWSAASSKGFYTGYGWCTDVYYSYDVGRTWKYQWSVRGATEASVAYWSVSWVGVYSYRC